MKRHQCMETSRGGESEMVRHLLCAVLACVLVALCSCESGVGVGLAGAATIRGVVTSFNGEEISLAPPAEPERLLHRLAFGASELIVPTALAVSPDSVQVRVESTDLVTTLGPDGFFIISGVPEGPINLVFSTGSVEALLPVSVPRNSDIDLKEIQIGREAVEVDRVSVKLEGETEPIENITMEELRVIAEIENQSPETTEPDESEVMDNGSRKNQDDEPDGAESVGSGSLGAGSDSKLSPGAGVAG